MRNRLILLAVLAVLVVLFFVFDLSRFASLDALKAQKAALDGFYQENPLLLMIGFFVIYVAVAGLSLPGAVILTLAGGAIFGLGTGLLLVSFASSIGATLAFLAARYLFQDSIQNKFGDKLSTFNDNIEKDGAFYLFTVRLVPVFPFFVVNLLMGLTKLKTAVFYFVSQIGMLPGTFVFVNAGTQLAQIDSLGGILSPKLLASFALLGIFPLVAKKLVDLIKAKQMRESN
jgi:uncharacterized membrane protein YdjX (TVP38/TMEM64 family)